MFCALTAHALVYQSLRPPDAAHGYFTWYAPAVAALTALSIVGVPLGLAVALVAGRGSRPTRVLEALLPRRSPDVSAAAETVRLAVGALVFLVAQESIEHSVGTHRLEYANFAPVAWLLVVAALGVAAAAVVFARDAVCSLVDVLCSAGRPRTRRATGYRRRPSAGHVAWPLQPLAVHGGLRAPPTRV